MFKAIQGNLDVLPNKGLWEGGVLENKRTALLSCPKCGKICSLSGHKIADDGIVTPSVVCPREDCDFHDYVKLVDWDGNKTEIM